MNNTVGIWAALVDVSGYPIDIIAYFQYDI
jgi:hypothetical protein